LPRVLHYDASMHVLVLEDLGPIPTLKAWLAESSTASTSQPFGTVLGCFLASVHKLHLSQPAVLSELGRDQPGRYLSATYYFASIAKKYGYHDQFIEQAAAVAHQKVLEGRDILAIGDFWPGNVLVCGNQLCILDFELVKPGTSSFDIGQMAAELYCLSQFANKEGGSAALTAFFDAYGSNIEHVDIVKVAIRVDAHFIVMAPTVWGRPVEPEGMSALLHHGLQLIKADWERDDDILRSSMLAPLYR
ncbi:hypothetical protein KCU67_g4474, partial [Aureobasidium melanogenum]